MKRSWKIFIPLMLVLVLLLAACNKTEVKVPDKTDPVVKDEGTTPAVEPEDKEVVIELPYPALLKKDGPTIGGTLNVGLVTTTPFEGIFNSFLYENAVDSDLMSPMVGSFVKAGANYEIVDGGQCDIEFNREAKTATYKIQKDLTWSDGVPVTAEDIIFVYETIAHKDYTGVRFDGDYKNVVGIMDYFDGKTDHISGIKKIDDKTVEVSFIEFYPGILWGAGITYNAEPHHYLKDIPVADMAKDPKIRLKPIACGPFMMSNLVVGESVEYVPNPHWYGEKVKLDKIVYKRTSPDTVVEALKAGTFDVIDGINVDSYLDYKDLSNIELVSNTGRTYDYIGFKMGKWDATTNKVAYDPNAKMSNKSLRQAIAYAKNDQDVAEVFFNNLRIPANSLVTPAHATLWNNKQAGYTYNPEKAKQILDEAGYVDKDGDGMREDPKGEKLKISFLARGGSEIAEPLAQFYIQCWREVGLDVVLQNGRLIEMNSFYDMLLEDNPDVDIYFAGWSVGSNPDPSSLYGPDAMYNMPRYQSAENDKLLKAIASEDAFGETGLDNEYLLNVYHEWQELMNDEVPVAPTHFRIAMTALNNRVNYWDLNTVNEWGWEKVGLLSDTPEKAK